jgi:SAM-dependent methyltransferase
VIEITNNFGLGGPFAPRPGFADLLARVNDCWLARRAQAGALAGPWAPGQKLDAALRARWEAALPMAEFFRDLSRLARNFLPSDAWLPLPLQSRHGCGCAPFASIDLPSSWPDFIGDLPVSMQETVLPLDESRLMLLLCLLADPPRFGTATGRYPQQLARLAALPPLSRPLQLLDLGCGTGHGTYEAVAVLEKAGQTVVATGITREPLEAWMAAARRLPHDPRRERQLAELHTIGMPHFLAGDFLRGPLPVGQDLILCNGVIGGPALNDDSAFIRLLELAVSALASGGQLLVADAFHDGRRPAAERFAALAQEQGWTVAGTAGDLALGKRE